MNVKIILLEPQMGENIGALARVMSNFAMTKLRIVRPRDGWPNPKAQAMAAGGVSIVDTAQIYDDFADAVADLNYLFATTAGQRHLPQKILTPRDASFKAVKLNHAGQKIGIVFGRESTGMRNEEIAQCQAIITIPCANFNTSCNLAQAAAIICYELYIANCANAAQDNVALKEDLPTQAQILWLVDYLGTELAKRNFFPTADRTAAARKNLAALFSTASFSARDFNLLAGMFKTLAEHSCTQK